MKPKKDEFPMPRTQAEIDAGLTGASPDAMAPASMVLEPKRFEVLRVVKGELADLSPYLDEGWEPVAVMPHGFNENIYYFKRLKS